MNSEMFPRSRQFLSTLAAIGIALIASTTVADAAAGQVIYVPADCWRHAASAAVLFQPPSTISARNFFAGYMEQDHVAWRFDLYWAATPEVADLTALNALQDRNPNPSGSHYPSRWYYNRVDENGRAISVSRPDWLEFANSLGRVSWLTTSEEKRVSLNWSGYWYTVATVYWYARNGRPAEYTRKVTGFCVR